MYTTKHLLALMLALATMASAAPTAITTEPSHNLAARKAAPNPAGPAPVVAALNPDPDRVL